MAPVFSAENEKNYFFQKTNLESVKTITPFLDKAQSWLGNHVHSTGELIDVYFGSEESFKNHRGSRLDILTPTTFHEDGRIYSVIRFRAKLELPRLNERWNLIVESAEDSISNHEEDLSSINNQKNEGNRASIGLQFRIKTENLSFSFLDAGVILNGLAEPNAYVRIKGAYNWDLSHKLSANMHHNLFYHRIEELGLSSRQIFEYEVNSKQLFRSRTSGTWWDSGQYYDLNHSFEFYNSINNHRSIAYKIGWNGDSLAKRLELTHFSYGLEWRELLYKKWLFFSVEPRINFSQETEFRVADPNITFNLEARFYKIK